ncbi:methyl-accepting chemotaxis protein [Vibrio orientalis CIP 102891 = ATCC 33934]|uniref:Methyl-accepting chemotaxis protein n=1 Tax=Vibrio orientalis CIP 102891 = ATCC 33934 TaxID=675816 RepID=C9QLY3_VIBOR|nr:methyl-accepting chemotaxis protein [Vibrio orientalis]EEX92909.1 hypothetical protein VIA_003554 [Vibrio orientalis CIP 102891 = ATCC 33934]EGU46592.1 methyl-accepting chemotaxis protein [Vibrio orientalis CIP 102891 = ATCC 33934]
MVQFLSRLRIKTKLLLSFLSMVVLFTIVNIYNLNVLNGDITNLNSYSNSSLSKINSVYDNEIQSTYEIRLLFLKAAGREGLDGTFISALDSWYESIERNFIDDGKSATQLRLENYKNYYYHVRNLAEVKNKYSAYSGEYAGFLKESDELASKLIQSLAEFSDEINSSIREDFRQTQAHADQVAIHSLIELAIISLVSLLFITYVASTIARPINDVAMKLNEMANGDFSVRYQYIGKNELGSLSSSINGLGESIGHIIEQVNVNSDGVAAAATELNSIMHQSRESSHLEKEQFAQISVAVTELSSTAKEVNANAAAAEEASDSALEFVSIGQKHIDDAQRSSEEVAKSINRSAEMIGELKGHSSDIGRVIEVINNISDQTNLLALNAAIEAARAGEQGRGFAVVADEVRGLAVQTQNSTAEIQNVIEALQEQASIVSDLTLHNVNLIKGSQESSQHVLGAFNEITLAVQKISEQNSLVFAASSEQADVTDSVSRSIVQVSEIVTDNTESIGHCFEASDELAVMSERQKELLSRYIS